MTIQTPQPCHCGDGRRFFCMTVYVEVAIMESGLTHRCFPANFKSPAEPATAAGAPLAPRVLCTRLAPASLPLPQAWPLLPRTPCQATVRSKGSGKLILIPALERTSRTHFLLTHPNHVKWVPEVLPSVGSLGL